MTERWWDRGLAPRPWRGALAGLVVFRLTMFRLSRQEWASSWACWVLPRLAWLYARLALGMITRARGLLVCHLGQPR